MTVLLIGVFTAAAAWLLRPRGADLLRRYVRPRGRTDGRTTRGRIGRRRTSARAADRRGGREPVAVADLMDELSSMLRAGAASGDVFAQLAAVHADDEQTEFTRAVAGRVDLGDTVSQAIRASMSVLAENDRRAATGLAAGWQLAAECGVPLAGCIGRYAESVRSDADARRAREAAMAGPRSTVTVLTWLPIGGVAWAYCWERGRWRRSPARRPAGCVCWPASDCCWWAGGGWRSCWPGPVGPEGRHDGTAGNRGGRLRGGIAGAVDGTAPIAPALGPSRRDESAAAEALAPAAAGASADGKSVEPALVLDLVAVALEGGLDPRSAITAASRSLGRRIDPAGDIDEAVNSIESAAGPGADEIATELRAALSFSAATGAPTAELLRSRADDLRRRQMRRAEEAAGRLGVRIVLPLGTCILPAFIALGVMPVVLSLVEQFAGIY